MKFLIKSLMASVVLAASLNVQAILIDRGNGMIYDSDQNLTWLQDANYAKTSGYDADGKMNWVTANAWADGLTVGGFTDWRLPTILDSGHPGCDLANSGTDCGYNVDTNGSELAYMYYNILGNKGYFDSSGNFQPDFGLQNTSADGINFLNLKPKRYWSGTEYQPPSSVAWYFDNHTGRQNFEVERSAYYAWAVRSGDVASVPEPSMLALLSLGMFGMAVGRRRA